MKEHWNWKKQLADLAAILVGNTVYAFAVAAFVLPNGLILGGSTGRLAACRWSGSWRRSTR